MYIYMYIRHC